MGILPLLLLQFLKELLSADTQLFCFFVFLVVDCFLQTLNFLYFFVLSFESATQRTLGFLPIIEHVLVGITHFLL
jgi:hypothetical protein